MGSPGQPQLAEDAWLTAFVNCAPCLIRIWQFAGPASSCKASVLTRGAGPVANCGRGGLLGEPSALPWQDWWPELARCGLMNQLRIPSDEKFISLDSAWVATRARPENINTSTSEGKPLIAFILKGRRDVAELLRRAGALLSRRVANELLYECAARGDVDPIDVLLFDSYGMPRKEPWASVNAQPKRHGGTPMDAAARKCNSACVERLRQAGGIHSLHWAAKHGLPEDVSVWLKDGADPDERDGSGATPLWAVVRGSEKTLKPRVNTADEADSVADSLRDQCVRLLLDARATVDVLPITMETPLLIAAVTGNTRRCAQLLAARADPMTCDREGRSVLDRATDPAVHELLQRAMPERARYSAKHEQVPLAFDAMPELHNVGDVSLFQPLHNGYNQAFYHQAPPLMGEAKGRRKGKGKGGGRHYWGMSPVMHF